MGAILLAPFARSNTDFLGLGERDVLKTVELVQRDYKIDAQRIYLCGASMGASGVWAIGAHHPHLFAAAAPAAGRTDYNLWQDVKRGELAEFKQFIVDRDYAATLKPNFRNLPVFAFHGQDDWLVQPEQSKRMVKDLVGMRFEARLREFPRGDHWSCFDAFDSDELVSWLRTKRRPAAPRRVSYRTYHPRFNRAYWVTIDDFAEFGRPAEIDVSVQSARSAAVKAENVARFTIDLSSGLFDGERLTARLSDGRTLKPTLVEKTRAVFTLSTAPEGPLRKRGEMCGPVWEAYQRPFMLVFGTMGEAEENLKTREDATKSAREWLDFAAGFPRLKKDIDVTEEDIRDCNLVLFGSPGTNLLVRRVAGKLPVRPGDGEFFIGEKSYDAAGAGLAMIYPNPLNPERYVVIYSGVHWGAGLPKNHKLDFLPDYIIFDDTIAPVSGTNNFKVAGFFDVNWKLDDKLMWFGPEKAPEKQEPLLPEGLKEDAEEPPGRPTP
jgi:predicted esterase